MSNLKNRREKGITLIALVVTIIDSVLNIKEVYEQIRIKSESQDT